MSMNVNIPITGHISLEYETSIRKPQQEATCSMRYASVVIGGKVPQRVQLSSSPEAAGREGINVTGQCL
jgi:hypothetical protein